MTAPRYKVLHVIPNERRSAPPVDVAAGISRETLRAARNGDQVAFAVLVRTYYPRCLRFAQHLLSNKEDAEECVQDTFVRVHRALHRYEERERFDAWLFRILANRCRTARRRVTRWSLFHSTDLDRVTPTSTARVDGFVARDEIWHALAELTEEQREAFLLRHVEGLNYEEIAAIAGIAVTAVRMRVSRACARLRDAILEADAER
ncbi:MAG: RNA polymerase sigma factor, partial [Gemmatimonadaceae bacterium]